MRLFWRSLFRFVSERRTGGMDLRQLFLFLLQALRKTRSDAGLQPDVSVTLVHGVSVFDHFEHAVKATRHSMV